MNPELQKFDALVAKLTAADQPFALENISVDGVEYRNYKAMPAALGDYFVRMQRHADKDFAVYQQVVKALFAQAQALQLPQPWHLFGQSTGGAVVVDHLLNHGADSPAQGKTFLLSPLVRPRAWGWSQVSYYLLRPFVKGIARRFSENTHDPAFKPFLEADPLQPRQLPTAWVGALARWIKRIEAAPRSTRRPVIVQGEEDMTVDWQHNLQVLRGKFDQPEVLMLPRGRHHLANEIPEIREVYFKYLTDRV